MTRPAYFNGMKTPMPIDDGLLLRVMLALESNPKAKAVTVALHEMDRRARLMAYTKEGLGLSAEELREAVDPAYDLAVLRRGETPAPRSRKRRVR